MDMARESVGLGLDAAVSEKMAATARATAANARLTWAGKGRFMDRVSADSLIQPESTVPRWGLPITGRPRNRRPGRPR
jgi:hypothetical protein